MNERTTVLCTEYLSYSHLTKEETEAQRENVHSLKT